MGLEGESPEQVNTFSIKSRIETIYTQKKLTLNGNRPVTFVPDKNLIFRKKY